MVSVFLSRLQEWVLTRRSNRLRKTDILVLPMVGIKSPGTAGSLAKDPAAPRVRSSCMQNRREPSSNRSADPPGCPGLSQTVVRAPS